MCENSQMMLPEDEPFHYESHMTSKISLNNISGTCDVTPVPLGEARLFKRQVSGPVDVKVFYNHSENVS